MNKQAKRKNNLFSLFELLIISVFWILLFASPFLLGSNEHQIKWQQISKIWVSFIPYLLLFVINRFVLLPYLFLRNKRLLFIGSAALLILILAFTVHEYQDDAVLPPNRFERNESARRPPESFARPPQERGQNPRPLPPPKRMPPYLVFVIISTLIVGFDTGLKLSVLWVHSEQKRVNTEKENMEIQLAFLRNQISPHFFMNTLNNIHALIDINTEDAKESVIKLSKLMRYLLYDSDHEKVPLSKEVEFIRSYVELMKLRYSDKVLINLSFPEIIPSMDISPMLFTSIVENAFKYGVSYQHESFIDILMNTDVNDLHFRIRNSVHLSEGKENESGGIGLVNLQKRLDLIYGKNHSITTAQSNDIFEINIRIPLYDN